MSQPADASEPLFAVPTLPSAVATRPVGLTREGSVFRLSFRYREDLVAKVRGLPFAEFDKDSKTWTCLVCAQAVQQLRSYFYEGLVDVPVDELLYPGETPAAVAAAVLRRGSLRRPFLVALAVRGDDTTFARLKAVAGAQWEKQANGLSYPPTAAPALAELVDRGVLADPDSVLNPAEVTVMFDARSGMFVVRGDDRAARAFAKYFPGRDVVAAWLERGLDVAFADTLSEEIYRGELARQGPGLQPDGLVIDLFPHQRRNVAVAVERSGFGVFDSPGVGKTACGIGAGVEALARKAVTRVVVVVPGAVRTQWKSEIVRFTGCDDDDVVVVKGDPKKRKAAYTAAMTRPWCVVNYDVLNRDLDALRPVFAGALVIADECHRLKTWDSQRSQAMKKLVRGAARRLALSGTPLDNAVNEFYEVVGGFVMPGALGAPQDFLNRYMFKAPFGGWQGARNLRELHERTKVYYARHTMEDVAPDMPPLRVQQLVVDPDAAYAAALKRAHKEARAEIKRAAVDRIAAKTGLVDQAVLDEVKTGADMTATGMLKLLCSSPRLIAESDAPAAVALKEAGIVPDDDGPKLDELRLMLTERKALQVERKRRMADAGETAATAEQVTPERVVVFTHSRRMANLISTRLTEDGVGHVLYTGTTGSDDRDAAVAAFTDPDSDVIAFVATDAASEGLNLGRCCNTLVSFEPAWTASRMEQRSCRIRRLDGTAPHYLVIVMVLAGTMEAGVIQLLGAKADLSDAVLGETGGRARTTGRRRHRWAKANLVEAALTSYDEAGGGWDGDVTPEQMADGDDQVPWPDEPDDLADIEDFDGTGAGAPE